VVEGTAQRTIGRLLAIPNASQIAAIGLPLLAVALYWFTGPVEPGGDVYIPLAGAFLHGELTVPGRAWMELIPVNGTDLWYVPFPPAPALFYLPVVAVMGIQPWNLELSANVMPAILGGASVALTYALLDAWGVALRPRVWLTVGFATSTFWWAAGTGSTHLFAQACGVFFALAALNLAVRRRWPLAAGLLLGLAAASRLPMGLTLPVLLALYGWRPSWRHAGVVLGLAVPAIMVAGYNLARFGSPTDFGYARIPSGEGLVTDEWWFSDGIISPTYILRNLNAMFLANFNYTSEPPFVRPSLSALSIVVTAPIYLFAARAVGRAVRDQADRPMVVVLSLTTLLVLLPDLMHGSWGFAQYGYRFLLDAVPVLLLLLGIVFRDRITLLGKAAVVLGAAAGAWGMFTIYALNFWVP
jgi:hypothetical protein